MSFTITKVERGLAKIPKKKDRISVYYTYRNPMDFGKTTISSDMIEVSVFTDEEAVVNAIRDKINFALTDSFFESIFRSTKEKIVGKTYDVFPKEASE